MDPNNQEGYPVVNRCPIPSRPGPNLSPVLSPPVVNRCPIPIPHVFDPHFDPIPDYCKPHVDPYPAVLNPHGMPFVPINNQNEIWFAENLPGFTEMYLSYGQQPTDDKIYVMYHGTSYEAAKHIIKYGFRRRVDGMLEKGIYVTRDIEKAKEYPKDIHTGKVVLKLRVNVGKVKRIDQQGHPMQWSTCDHDYDSAWLPPNCDMNPTRVEKDCVWDPMRIKVVGIASANPPILMLDLEGLLHHHK